MLREATAKDADFILRLVNEPAWLRFIYSHSINTHDKALDYINEKLIASYAQHGFGLWIVEKLDDGSAIGICGLLTRGYLKEADLGFAFLSEYWGQGYAYEAALSALEFAAK